jgi:hypothetical protein
MGRGGAGGATQRKEGGGLSLVVPRGGGRCGGPGGVWRRQGHAADRGERGRLVCATQGTKGGSGRAAAARPSPWAGPRAQCRI